MLSAKILMKAICCLYLNMVSIVAKLQKLYKMGESKFFDR